MEKNNIRVFVALHCLLVLYSLSGICSKLAASTKFLSFEFIMYYGAIILLLGVYAIGWQQIIKRLPLTTAFANKAITIVWGIVWGCLFFGEAVTVQKIVGAIVIIAGIVLYVYSDKEAADEK